MSNTGNAQNKGRLPWIKLVLLGILGFCVIGFSLFWMKYGAIIGPLIYTPPWRKDFDAAQENWSNNRSEGDRRILKAIKDAEASGASPLEKMGLHRDYANLLYRNGEYSRGHDEITAAIAEAPKQLGPLEADMLSHVYQDRGWEMHGEHNDDPADPSGVEDQEKSVAVCEKAFGPNSQQTLDKVAGLATIYAELGMKDKSEKALKRVIDASEQVKACAACGWFGYAMKARIRAGEKDYKEALKAYLHACSIAHSEAEQDRVWEEFTNGLYFKRPKVAPELVSVEPLLNKCKYKDLDALAARLRKSGVQVADGHWLLDDMYVLLEGADRRKRGKWQSDDTYQQRIFDLGKWLKAEPKSPTARVALADTYVEYAWFARGNGYANTVTEKGGRIFHDRIKKSKELLDADPSIRQEDPRAYMVYGRIARAEGMDKGAYLKFVEASHKDWPGYNGADFGATQFLLPRWYGEPGETEAFINKRAATIGGTKGDMVRTQLACNIVNYLDDVFSEHSALKWTDIKRGFIEVFKKYPDDMEMRVNYMQLARPAGDEEGFEKVFDY